jgi:triosephosphate isomerase
MKLSSCCFLILATATSGFTFQTRPNIRNVSPKLDSKSTSTSLYMYGKDPNPVFPIQHVPVDVQVIGGTFASTTTSSTTTSSPNNARRPIVAGNWKLNPSTRNEAIDLLNGLKAGGNHEAEVVIFPPLPYLSDALNILDGTGIKVGAQNAGSATKGAFTGETAPSMLASAGCSYVLLGHSERRSLFGESDASINERVKACLDEPTLNIVLCVGETLSEYESGLLRSVVDTQLRKGLAGVSADDLLAGRVVIAYEPVWAIGTGLVATPDQAQAAHVAVRETLSAMHPDHPDVAMNIRIQYGGSVSPESVTDLMAMSDVDGALVGGASLMADSFTKIIQGSVAAPPGASLVSTPKAVLIGNEKVESKTKTFSHAPISYFDIEKLKSKGPRKNADVGEPHDSSRPLAKDGSLSTGSWWCAAGGWPSPALRATTEVFYVLEGHGCVSDLDGTRNFFGPGDTVILPKGWSGRWDVLQDIHKVWAVTDHPDVQGSTKAIVKPYNTFSPQYLKPQGVRAGAVHGSPSVASETFLDNGYMGVGSWTCTPGSFPISNPPTSEAFFILEGVFFLTNADGTAQKCKAGDTVLLPKGWSGHWDIIETVKKLWVVVK